MKPPKLLLLSAPGGKVLEEFSIDRHETVLGRVAGVDVMLDDPKVSRRHAVVLRTKSGFEVRVLEGRNGIWLGDRRVERAALRDGDSFRVGSSHLSVNLLPVSGAVRVAETVLDAPQPVTKTVPEEPVLAEATPPPQYTEVPQQADKQQYHQARPAERDHPAQHPAQRASHGQPSYGHDGYGDDYGEAPQRTGLGFVFAWLILTTLVVAGAAACAWWVRFGSWPDPALLWPF